jgi:membrane protein
MPLQLARRAGLCGGFACHRTVAPSPSRRPIVADSPLGRGVPGPFATPGQARPAASFVSQTVRNSARDDIQGLAAELAFRLFVALFPFCIFLAACGAIIAGTTGFDDSARDVAGAAGDTLPDDVASRLERQTSELIGTRSVEPLVLGLFAAIWTGAMSVATAIKALNRIHAIEETRSYKRRIGLTLLLTLACGLLIVGAFAVILAGEMARGNELFGNEWLSSLLLSLRWLIVFVMVAVTAALLYWLGPDRKTAFRWSSAGSAVFALAWVLGSLVLALYYSNFGAFNATYGTLAGILMLLIWFYVSSLAFLAGAEVDAVLQRRHPQH